MLHRHLVAVQDALFIRCQLQSSPSTLSPHRPDQHIDRLHSFLACSCTGPSLVERRRHIPTPALILQCLSPFGTHTKPLGLSPPNTATHRLFWPDSRLNRSRCCGALLNEIPNPGIRHIDQLVLALIAPQPVRCRYIHQVVHCPPIGQCLQNTKPGRPGVEELEVHQSPAGGNACSSYQSHDHTKPFVILPHF